MSFFGGVVGSLDPNTALLLNLNGSNGQTTTTDKSKYRHSVTFNGGASLTTSTKKYGTAALTLDGNGDYLSVADHASLNFGSSDFTIEFWRYATSNSASAGSYASFGTGTGSPTNLNGLELYQGNTGLFVVVAPDSPTDFGFNFVNNVSTSTWQHICVERSGNTFRGYIDGVVKNSATRSFSIASPGGFRIGHGYAGFSIGADLNPNVIIDDYRISNVARYSGAFTPPTSELKR